MSAAGIWWANTRQLFKSLQGSERIDMVHPAGEIHENHRVLRFDTKVGDGPCDFGRQNVADRIQERSRICLF